jgi:hypothetical protein
MYYNVVNVTAERWTGKPQTYAVVSDREYQDNHEYYHDRLYQGGMTKKDADHLAKHLNKNTHERYTPC